MGVEVSFDGKNHYIQVKGELVSDTVMDALAQFKRACKEHDQWTIDFTGVSRVDSTAVALLIELKRNAREQGRDIAFIYLPDALISIARLSQADSVISS